MIPAVLLEMKRLSSKRMCVWPKMETVRMPVPHGQVEAAVQQHKKGHSFTYRLVVAITESLDGFEIAK